MPELIKESSCNWTNIKQNNAKAKPWEIRGAFHKYKGDNPRGTILKLNSLQKSIIEKKKKESTNLKQENSQDYNKS